MLEFWVKGNDGVGPGVTRDVTGRYFGAAQRYCRPVAAAQVRSLPSTLSLRDTQTVLVHAAVHYVR